MRNVNCEESEDDEERLRCGGLGRMVGENEGDTRSEGDGDGEDKGPTGDQRS